ncbi:DUF4956 domain-containing protein [Nocardioides sp.]|uniref:DUF4956 domain-containing protein n=1 Tax=Nocardioides sp. TaxID=35761 RepID=UPI0025F63C58|nr:DUF4956 domain-containing protein [Nocardioides sp.]
MLDTALSSVVGRLGLDVIAILVLVGILHRRRSTLPEMALVLTSLNIGLFAAVTVIGTGDFPTGIGFGLFGLLSLVRLRSAAFTLKDVAYTFLALVLALVNGLPERDLALVLGLNLVILAAVWVTDDSRRQPTTRRIRVVLDRAVFDEVSARAALAERITEPPVAVVIEDIDTVRDTTRVSVLVESTPGWWATRDQTSVELDDELLEPGAGR